MKKLFICIVAVCMVSSLIAMKRTADGPAGNTRGTLRRREDDVRRKQEEMQQSMNQAITENNVEAVKILLRKSCAFTNEIIRKAIEVGRPEILKLLKEHDLVIQLERDPYYQDGFTELSLAYALKLRLNVQSDEKEKLMRYVQQLSTVQAREIGERTDYITSTIDLIDTREKIIEMTKVHSLVRWQEDLFWAMQHHNKEAQDAMLMFIRQVRDTEEQECRKNNHGDLCGYHEDVTLPMLESILENFQRLYQERKYIVLAHFPYYVAGHYVARRAHNYELLIAHTYEEVSWDDLSIT